MIEGGAEADTVSFNSVINAFAREAIYNGSSSCSRAEYWFTEMKSRGIEPTIKSYTQLVKKSIIRASSTVEFRLHFSEIGARQV